MIDLHTHTTYSDGTDRPAELVAKAYVAGIRILAITDHDITDGLPEARQAAAECRGLDIIAGIEMSCEEAGQEIHILGYWLDPAHQRLQARLADLREERLTRADRMIEQLDRAGIRLDPERVKAIAGTGSIGRPHLARALWEGGHVRSLAEAFDRYLTPGKPGYVAREKLTIAAAIDLIQEAGGVASIAHPLGLIDLPRILQSARVAGLRGIETHYGSYNSHQIERLKRLAESFDLIPTGGSDYHGSHKEGVALGDAAVPLADLRRLREAAGRATA